MKKVILSAAVVALGFAATSCNKSYTCDCQNASGYTTSTVKASNATEASYTCSNQSTAPGTAPASAVSCQLR
ncbi:MAG: hypothetical protein JST67_03965 [Bacteroidetes bacterium]|nr:hypothetical protein [Bacteroidota bacterium]